jgi:hypothetical protein
MARNKIISKIARSNIKMPEQKKKKTKKRKKKLELPLPHFLWADAILLMHAVHFYEQHYEGFVSEFKKSTSKFLSDFVELVKPIREKENDLQVERIRSFFIEQLTKIYRDFVNGKLNDDQYRHKIDELFESRDAYRLYPKSFKAAFITKAQIKKAPVSAAVSVVAKLFDWQIKESSRQRDLYRQKEKCIWTQKKARAYDELAKKLNNNIHLSFAILQRVFGLNEKDALEVAEVLKQKLDPFSCPIYYHYDNAYYLAGKRVNNQKPLDGETRGWILIAEKGENPELSKKVTIHG